MTMKIYALLALAALTTAFHLNAATITPVTPTEQDVINATIDVSSAFIYDPPVTSVTGNMIRTTLPAVSVIAGPPIFITHQFASFGPLPQGTYTYEVRQTFQGQSVLISQQTIVIAPPIPTMSGMYLSILGLFLVVIACLTLGKHA